MINFEDLSQSVVCGKESQVKEQVEAMIESGIDPIEIINQGLIAGMNIVGPRFKNGEMFVPEVLMAAKTMAVGIEILQPLIDDKDMLAKGTVVIGTVQGDLHDIGKNLVSMMLSSSGYKVIDLGIDIAPEKFVEAVKEYNPDIVGMSALLTTTMPAMKDTVKAIKQAGLNVECIVGGAPISQDFSDEIGANGFAPDAASAVELCAKLV